MRSIVERAAKFDTLSAASSERIEAMDFADRDRARAGPHELGAAGGVAVAGSARDTPDAALAAALAASATGRQPIAVERFTTGLLHYVFEARFAGLAPVVVRIAAEHGRAAMIGGAKLSGLLRPLGVPLPRIIAENLIAPFPYLVLERLPGTDLGNVVKTLAVQRLAAIAAAVAQAQRITAGTASHGRYGYGVAPTDAPNERWSKVLETNLARSRTRIAAAGFFGPGPVDAMVELVMKARGELDSQPPIPFLHDTTTKNVIVTAEGAFSGIVDVDDLCFGDPRYVVALTLASLTAASGPPDYADAWMKIANFRDDKIFRLYVALFLLDFMSEHGQAFNQDSRVSSPEARRRLLEVFGANLQRAMS